MSRYRALGDDARERVRDTFIQRDGDGFSAIPDTELLEILSPDGDDRADAVRFLRYDYMLMRWATGFGAAYFEKDAAEIERVRWRVTSQRVNDFLTRFDEDDQHAPAVTTFGWRQVTTEVSDRTVALYADMIERYTAR